MGLYIPNVDMPKDDKVLTIQICPDGSIWQQYRGTVPNAKAVPVPPHGRLGDLDKLENGLRHMAKYQHGERQQGILGCCETIRLAPTIIQEDNIGDANQMVNNDYAGLKVKYIVRKASNGELVDDCFVLRPDKDQAAIAALNAYADATENQVLAADIRKWLSSKISAEPRVIKWREWNRIGAEEGET